MEQTKKTLSESEAAEYIGIAHPTLRKARAQGARPGHLTPPPHLQVGRRVLYLQSDLDQWLESLRVNSRPGGVR